MIGDTPPTAAALLEAAKWFDWPDNKERLALAFDEFARQAAERERERCRNIALGGAALMQTMKINFISPERMAADLANDIADGIASGATL